MDVKHRLGGLVDGTTRTVRARARSGLLDVRKPEVGRLVRRVRAERLTYLQPESLADLARTMLSIERRGLPGAVVEAGTALGGSAIVIAKAKSPTRPMKVYDAFGMIPPPSDKDGERVQRRYQEIVDGKSRGIQGDVYYGYRDDLLSEVMESFSRLGVPPEPNRVEFIKGYYEETMHIDYPVALAHLDCDWYESVMTCLREIEPHLTPGGRVVVDDYYHWAGCARAVDEFFAGRPGYRFEHQARLHVVKHDKR